MSIKNSAYYEQRIHKLQNNGKDNNNIIKKLKRQLRTMAKNIAEGK